MPTRSDPTRRLPSAWVGALLNAQHTRWPAGRSIRGALTMGGPLLVGLLIDRLDDALWISLAALLMTIGEKQPAYRSRFVQIAATAPPTALAFFLGDLAALPNAVIVVVMTAVAFASGVLSGYSKLLSAATMWVMLVGAIAIGTPSVQPTYRTVLLFVAGVAIYVVLLAAEAAVNRRRPQRDALVALLRALAALSSARVHSDDIGTQRAHAIAAMEGFDAIAVAARGNSGGPTGDYRRAALIVRAADQLTARILAPDADPDRCAQAARRLTASADAVASGADSAEAPERLPLEGTVLIRVRTLEAALWDDEPSPAPRSPLRSRPAPPSRALLTSAAALTLCTAIAYGLFLWLPVVWPSMSHGYWIPATVALVMKPDLGSIFTRATLRTIGTMLGAVIGVAISAVVTEPQAVALAVAVVGAALPWAVGRSYMWQGIAITPLLMMLLSLTPDTTADGIGLDRAVSNAIGGVVAIVFGYAIWPSIRNLSITAPFTATMSEAADYLRSVVHGGDVAARRTALYRSLSGMRTVLQRTLAEPPPAGTQAWAWIPVVASAERIADRITGLTTMLGTRPQPSDIDALAERLDTLADGPPTGSSPTTARSPLAPKHGGDSSNPAVRDLADEIAYLGSMLSDVPDVR